MTYVCVYMSYVHELRGRGPATDQDRDLDIHVNILIAIHTCTNVLDHASLLTIIAHTVVLHETSGYPVQVQTKTPCSHVCLPVTR